MIHVGEVAQFVDNYIVQHMGRSHHQPPVKGKGTVGGTTSPAGLLLPDGDGMVGASGKLLKICHSLWKIAFRYLPVFFLQKSFLDVGVTTVLFSDSTEFAVIFQQPVLPVPKEGSNLPV